MSGSVFAKASSSSLSSLSSSSSVPAKALSSLSSSDSSFSSSLAAMERKAERVTANRGDHDRFPLAIRLDVVIPVAPKDYPKFHRSLGGILENSSTPINHIYVIAKDDEVLKQLKPHQKEKVFLIKEAQFPFTKADVQAMLKQKGSLHEHASWYYQQLLKFYVFKVIENACDHILILDSDFVFRQKIPFISDKGKALLANGYPFKWLLNTDQYPQSVEHIHAEFAKRFIPGWQTVSPFSGMQHHMVFQRDIMNDLFMLAEQYHSAPFWQALISTVEIEKWNAASEYVIYYHFALSRHPNKVAARHLNACDIIHDEKESSFTLRKLDALIVDSNFQAVGCHGFVALQERIQSMDYIPPDLKADMLKEEVMAFTLQLNEGVLRVAPISIHEAYLLRLLECLAKLFNMEIHSSMQLKALFVDKKTINNGDFIKIRRAISEEFGIALPFNFFSEELTIGLLAEALRSYQASRPVPALKTEAYSVVEKELIVSYDQWVMSICGLRDPQQVLGDHWILIMEGFNTHGKKILAKLHLVENSTNPEQAKIIVEAYVTNPTQRDMEEVFEARVLKYNPIAFYKSWVISRQQALDLIQDARNDQRKTIYFAYPIVDGKLVTPKSPSYTCYMWAREKVHNLGDPSIWLPAQPKGKDTISDYFTATDYLKADERSFYLGLYGDLLTAKL